MINVVIKKRLLVLSAFLTALLIFISGCHAGSSTTSGGSPSAAISTSPARLAFITQPVGSQAGTSLNTQPVVAIQDANGNLVANSSLPVKLTISSGSGADEAVLLGPSTINAAQGLAAFKNLSITQVGANYTLTAASGKLTAAISMPFAITPGQPSKLIFTVQPSGGTAGLPFATAPEVRVQDRFGNTVTSYAGPVSLNLIYNAGPSGASILGTPTVLATDGVARFTGIAINKTYPEYKLAATSGSLNAAISSTFAISAGTPVKLEFTIQTAGAKAGTAFETQPKVAVEDSYDNVVTSSRASISVVLNPETAANGAALSGTATLIAEGGMGGLAVFTDLSIDKVGTGYTLTASSEGLASATSAPFDVLAP